MESDISENEIWLNLCVSASNELGRVLEEGSLVVSLVDFLILEQTFTSELLFYLAI